MVACAALPAQPLISLAAPMTTSPVTVGYVDQLRQQLLTAIENDDEESLFTAVSEIERLTFTKELLEATRFGADVNSCRKKITDKWPSIAKRCRNLIKGWQQLIQPRTGGSSCASSANGTPNLVNKRLTPATPVNKRVTSTGIADTRQTLSPSAGYAPRTVASPVSQTVPSMHKSQSVGGDLARKVEETPRNGKRKAEECLPGQSGSNAGLKRTKTVACQLASPAPRTESVLAARRTVVQSTADLISQLSSNLPEHMSIDQSLRQHEEKVRREQADEELAHQVASSTPPIKGKRKYERKANKTPATPTLLESRTVVDIPKGGLILRLSRTPAGQPERSESPAVRSQSPLLQPAVPTVSWEDEPSSSSTTLASRPGSSRGKVDWMAMLPSLKELRLRAERQRPTPTLPDQKLSHVVKAKDRVVLALPYLSDVDPRPDFLLYNYPNKQQYYSEENFLYGGERPKE